MNNKDRIAATMYPLETWFVSGICVWIPCIKETMMMMVMIIMLLYFTLFFQLYSTLTFSREPPEWHTWLVALSL
jgi:hypothetical protein